MIKDFWLNLPVKDLVRSREFFRQLGFNFNDQHGQSGMVSLLMGEKGLMINLFPDDTFKSFAGAGVSDARRSAEVLLSFDAESRAEVDAITEKARAAGATVFGEPAPVQGWMYGSGFADLDGHRWNVLFMDFGKMPKG